MGGNLEAVFEERDHPTEQDYFEQGVGCDISSGHTRQKS
jgi:hypothetical protein